MYLCSHALAQSAFSNQQSAISVRAKASSKHSFRNHISACVARGGSASRREVSTMTGWLPPEG
jgi:hypothetical protein